MQNNTERKNLSVFLVFHCHKTIVYSDESFRIFHDKLLFPFIESLFKPDSVKISLHLTGPTIEWLFNNAPLTLKKISEAVFEEKVEIIGGGWEEAFLPLIPLTDSIGQIRTMKIECVRKLGILPKGIFPAYLMWDSKIAMVASIARASHVFVDEDLFSKSEMGTPPYIKYFIAKGKDKGGLRDVALIPVRKVPFSSFVKTGIEETLNGYIERDANSGGFAGFCIEFPEEIDNSSGIFDEFISHIWELEKSNRAKVIFPSEVLKLYSCGGSLAMDFSGSKSPDETKNPFQDLIGRNDFTCHLYRRILWISEKIFEKENKDRKLLDTPSVEAILARRALYRAEGILTSLIMNDGFLKPEFAGAVYAKMIEAENFIRDFEPSKDMQIEGFDLFGNGQKLLYISGKEIRCLVNPHSGGTITELNVASKRINLSNYITFPEKLERLRQIKDFQNLKKQRYSNYIFCDSLLFSGTPVEKLLEMDSDEELRKFIAKDLRNSPFSVVDSKVEGRVSFLKMVHETEVLKEKLKIVKQITIDDDRKTISANYELQWTGEEPFEGLFMTENNILLSALEEGKWKAKRASREEEIQERNYESGKWVESVSSIRATGESLLHGKLSVELKVSPPCNITTITTNQSTFVPVVWGVTLFNWTKWSASITLKIDS